MNTSRFNTRKMCGYHRPKNHKRRFIVEHVVTLAISIIAANSKEEALAIFTTQNNIPLYRVRIYPAY